MKFGDREISNVIAQTTIFLPYLWIQQLESINN